jgi:hypothetical protein
MYKKAQINKNIIFSLFLILIFILSTNSAIQDDNVNSKAENSDFKILQPINTNKGSESDIRSVEKNSYQGANGLFGNTEIGPELTSLEKIESLPSPLSYQTVTLYKNSTNFNEVNITTANVLPFAERYRLNSTLDGWASNYGLTSDYIPMKNLVYNHTLIPNGTSIYTNTVGDFPYTLKFIKDYPVYVKLDVQNVSADGDVDLYVFNATDNLVASSTLTLPNAEELTFVPTSENEYYIQIEHRVDSGKSFSNISLTIQQFITPKYVNVLMGDSTTNESTYYWDFYEPVKSIGFDTPETVDINTVVFNRSDSFIEDYLNTTFPNYGIDNVYDNDTWIDAVDSYFKLTSQKTCNTAKAEIDMCQSFTPIFFFSGADLIDLETGQWISSLEENHVFGANPQVMRFSAYFGQSTPIITPTKIEVTNSLGKVVLDLSSSFTNSPISTFGNQVTVGFSTANLLSGTYTMNFYDNIGILYSYPFKVEDTKYGNYDLAKISIGYKPITFTGGYLGGTVTDGTVVYVEGLDSDTTIDKIQFSYSTDGTTYSTTRDMVWLDINKWGYVIPKLASNVLNWTLSVFESAPSDVDKGRIQVQAQFLPDVIDLSVNTSTTLKITVKPHGLPTSTTTQVLFVKNGQYNLIGINGAVITENTTHFIYIITGVMSLGTTNVSEYTITPKNNGLLIVDVIGTSGIVTDNGKLTLNVFGLTLPNVEISFVTDLNGNLKNLYPYLNETYPVTVKYRFIGGTPTANYNIVVTGSGSSLTKTTLIVDKQETYPLVYYEKTVVANVTKTFTGATTDITANITFGSKFTPITKTIFSYKPVVTGVFNDLNGYPITDIYNKLIDKFELVYQIRFFNGTPKDSLSVDLSSLYVDFPPKTIDVNISSIISDNINISVSLEKSGSISKTLDYFKSIIHWDGNSDSFQQLINLNLSADYPNLLTVNKLTNDVLSINKSLYKIEFTIKSTMVTTQRNVGISLENSYNINSNPIIISEIKKNEQYNFSFDLTYEFSELINIPTLSFKVNVAIPGLKIYSITIQIATDSNKTPTITSTDTMTTSTDTPNKSTPGFELGLIAIIIPAILINRKRKLI